jgi:hypothetical protein
VADKPSEQADGLDRESRIMLMLFPEDATNNAAIGKSISGFGLLCY